MLVVTAGAAPACLGAAGAPCLLLTASLPAACPMRRRLPPASACWHQQAAPAAHSPLITLAVAPRTQIHWPPLPRPELQCHTSMWRASATTPACSSSRSLPAPRSRWVSAHAGPGAPHPLPGPSQPAAPELAPSRSPSCLPAGTQLSFRVHLCARAPTHPHTNRPPNPGAPTHPPAGAGAILVNPWNINDLSQAIEYALMMSDAGGDGRGGWAALRAQLHGLQPLPQAGMAGQRPAKLPALDADMARILVGG